MDDEFGDIAEKAIEKAERVKGSIEDFYRGLRTMIQTLESRMECASADGVDLSEL